MRSGAVDEHRSQRRTMSLHALVLMLALLGAGIASQAGAQAPVPAITIVGVHHSVDGRIVAAIRAEPPEGLNTAAVVARLNGAIRPAQTTTVKRDDTALALVVDTSGSMAGQPMEAVRRAITDLVTLVPQQDPVALITFSDTPQVIVPFTTDRASLLTAAANLTATGNTALYDAVALASDLLVAAPQQQRQLVLLSDGVDSGGASQHDRAASQAASVRSGAAVFAVGLGNQVDTAYLGALTSSTGGTMHLLADERALAAIFREHGNRLGATHVVDVASPVLTPGEHEIALAATLGQGQQHIMARRFSVTNDGLLRPRLVLERGSPEESVITLDAAVPLEGVELYAEAAGRPIPFVPGTQRVIVDHWTFSAGRIEVAIVASVDGMAVATASLPIDVPLLAPQLEVIRSGEPGQMLIRWRAQGSTEGWAVSASASGREFGRWADPQPEFSVTAPPEAPNLDVQLLRADGTVAQRRALEAAGSTQPVWFVPLLATIVAVSVAGMLVRYTLSRPVMSRSQGTGRRRRPRQVSPAHAAVAADMFVVVDGDAGERRFAFGRRPLVVGSASDCDVVIADAGVRTVHARLALLPDGSVRMHTVDRAASRTPAAAIEQWLRLQPGDQIQVGRHVLRFEASASESR